MILGQNFLEKFLNLNLKGNIQKMGNKKRIFIHDGYWTLKTKYGPRHRVGEVDFDKRILYISPKQNKTELICTIVHEILHIIYPYIDEDFIEKGEDLYFLTERILKLVEKDAA